MTEQQKPETPKPDTEAKTVPPSERHDPTMLTPEELESLRQEAKRSSERMRAILAARRAKPVAPTEWRSPTMLSPEELEDLRQDDQRAALKIRAILAARRTRP